LRAPAEERGTPTFEIRAAVVDDVGAVAEIEAISFSNPWPPETFRSLISEGRAHILVAEGAVEDVVGGIDGEIDGETDGEIMGYAVVWWVMEQGELANLAVRESHQGKGIGSALLDRVTGDAAAQGVESLFLEVRKSNERALGLYLARGFTQIAVRRDYYQNPKEDAQILLKDLRGPAES